MRDDFACAICHVGVSDAVEKRVLCCKGVKRQETSASDMSRGGIAEVGGDGESALIELLAQCVLGEPVHCCDHKGAQHQHHPGKNAADLPLETQSSRLPIHFYYSWR